MGFNFPFDCHYYTWQTDYFGQYYKWKQQRTQWKMAIRSRPSYRILIIGSSGSGKTNTLLSLIKEQDDTDNLFECKRFKWTQISIFDQKVRRCRNKTVKWSKCIYWVLKYDGWLYENIDHYNPSRKRKILTVFDDMIVDIITNKKFQTIIKESFIRLSHVKN